MSRFRKKSGFKNVFGRSDGDKGLLHSPTRSLDGPSNPDDLGLMGQSGISNEGEEPSRRSKTKTLEQSLPTIDSPRKNSKQTDAKSDEHILEAAQRPSLRALGKSTSEKSIMALKEETAASDGGQFSPLRQGRAGSIGVAQPSAQMAKAPQTSKPQSSSKQSLNTPRRAFLKKNFSERFNLIGGTKTTGGGKSGPAENRIGEITVNLSAVNDAKKNPVSPTTAPSSTTPTSAATAAASVAVTAATAALDVSKAGIGQIGSFLTKPRKKRDNNTTSMSPTRNRNLEATIQIVPSNDMQRSFRQLNLGDMVPSVVCKAARSKDLMHDYNKRNKSTNMVDESSSDDETADAAAGRSPDEDEEKSLEIPISRSAAFEDSFAGHAEKSATDDTADPFGASTFVLVESQDDLEIRERRESPSKRSGRNHRRSSSNTDVQDGTLQTEERSRRGSSKKPGNSERGSKSLASDLRDLDTRTDRMPDSPGKDEQRVQGENQKTETIENGGVVSDDEQDAGRSDRKGRKSRSRKEKRSKTPQRANTQSQSYEVLTWVRSSPLVKGTVPAETPKRSASLDAGGVAFSPPASPKSAEHASPYTSPSSKKSRRRRSLGASDGRTSERNKHSRRNDRGNVREDGGRFSGKESSRSESRPSVVSDDDLDQISSSRIDEMKAVMDDFERMDFTGIYDNPDEHLQDVSLEMKEIPFTSYFSHLKERAGGVDFDDMNDDMSVLAEKLGIGSNEGESESTDYGGLWGRYKRLQSELEQSKLRLFQSSQEVTRMEREVDWLKHRLEELQGGN